MWLEPLPDALSRPDTIDPAEVAAGGRAFGLP